jgi:hypothetical protein
MSKIIDSKYKCYNTNDTTTIRNVSSEAMEDGTI